MVRERASIIMSKSIVSLLFGMHLNLSVPCSFEIKLWSFKYSNSKLLLLYMASRWKLLWHYGVLVSLCLIQYPLQGLFDNAMVKLSNLSWCSTLFIFMCVPNVKSYDRNMLIMELWSELTFHSALPDFSLQWDKPACHSFVSKWSKNVWRFIGRHRLLLVLPWSVHIYWGGHVAIFPAHNSREAVPQLELWVFDL